MSQVDIVRTAHVIDSDDFITFKMLSLLRYIPPQRGRPLRAMAPRLVSMERTRGQAHTCPGGTMVQVTGAVALLTKLIVRYISICMHACMQRSGKSRKRMRT